MEKLKDWVFGKKTSPLSDSSAISDPNLIMDFAMYSNGFLPDIGSNWRFDKQVWDQLNTHPHSFDYHTNGSLYAEFISNHLCDEVLFDYLNQDEVLNLISRHLTFDELSAQRISYILGGIARYGVSRYERTDVEESIAYIAKLAGFGVRGSREAVAAALAMQFMDVGPLDKDPILEGNVYHMTGALDNDPIEPLQTDDLGLSQTMRLLGFLRSSQGLRNTGPDRLVADHHNIFHYFPTVGAEFHIPTDKVGPNFRQRLAVLNMSGYFRNSDIQFSREEDGDFEIRMNPSIYPITVANWNLYRLLLPELNTSYFTMTITQKGGDFSKGSTSVTEALHSLGSLCFAGVFENSPEPERPKDAPFGGRHISQTVYVEDGKFRLTGNYNDYGQLDIFTGFGNLFSDMAYYLSMASVEPKLLDIVTRNIGKGIKTSKAVERRAEVLADTLEWLTYDISKNNTLVRATELGEEVIAQLSL